MANPTERATAIQFNNPGPLDSWEGPWNSIAEACAKIKNVEVLQEGAMVNFRLGKKPMIRINGKLVQYWWPNGRYEDTDIAKFVEEPNLSGFVTKTAFESVVAGNDVIPALETIGVIDALDSYTSTANSNLRIIPLSPAIDGVIKKIELYGVSPGTLKVRIMQSNGNGSYTCMRLIDLSIASGNNVITTESGLPEGVVFNRNYCFGIYLGTGETQYAKIGYKTGVPSDSISLTGGADVVADQTIFGLTASTVKFGIRITVESSDSMERTIKESALPSSVMKKDEYLKDEDVIEEGEEVVVIGVSDDLGNYNSSTSTNLRILSKYPATKGGFLRKLELNAAVPGTLKLRFFKNLGNGSYTCYRQLPISLVQGINVLLAGIAFDNGIEMAADDLLGYHANNGASIAYKTGIAGDSLSLTGGADVALDQTISGLSPSSALFAIRYSLGEFTVTTKKVIDPAFIPAEANKKKLSQFENDLNIESGKHLEMFNRGNSPKVYADTKKYGILIAGQSNTRGVIPYSELPQWFLDAGRQIPGVRYSNLPSVTFSTFSVAANSIWAYDLFLYKSMIDYLRQKYSDPAYEMYVIKHSIAGTSISVDAKPTSPGYWDPRFELIPGDKPALTKDWEKRINDILSGAQGANFDIRCVVWHQGESDQGDPENYYDNLKNLIWYVRGVLNNPRLTWILGGINTASTSYSSIVQDAKIRLANEDKYIHYVEVLNGAQYLISDSLHWNAVGGKDFADKVFPLIKDIQPSSSLNGGYY